MKKSAVYALLFLSITIYTQEPMADIVISEVIESEGENCTLLKILNDNGEQKEKVIVKGLLARLSPDKNQIAYIDHFSKGGFQLALSNTSGSKVEQPPFIEMAKTIGWRVTGLEWSHDGNEIAIVLSGQGFYKNGIPVRVIVYNFKSNKYNNWYESKSQTSESAYFLFVKWFPDNKRILIQDNLIKGNEKIVLTSADKGQQSIVYEGSSLYSNIINNGKTILMIPVEKENSQFVPKNNASIKCQVILFDIEKKISHKIIETDILKNLALTYITNSEDSKVLILPSNIANGKSIKTVNLENREMKTVSFGSRYFFPQAIFKDGRNLVLCGRTEKGYEIFNFETKEFKCISPFESALSGEAALGAVMFFNRIKWVK